ncbi:hypothetical protein BDW22DRAFT_1341070 [Trametopsis cervina]|nr:hypothetical protein BDW22DRAFT_1341070 [Trametopsis cervina]
MAGRESTRTIPRDSTVWSCVHQGSTAASCLFGGRCLFSLVIDPFVGPDRLFVLGGNYGHCSSSQDGVCGIPTNPQFPGRRAQAYEADILSLYTWSFRTAMISGVDGSEDPTLALAISSDCGSDDGLSFCPSGDQSLGGRRHSQL